MRAYKCPKPPTHLGLTEICDAPGHPIGPTEALGMTVLTPHFWICPLAAFILPRTLIQRLSSINSPHTKLSLPGTCDLQHLIPTPCEIRSNVLEWSCSYFHFQKQEILPRILRVRAGQQLIKMMKNVHTILKKHLTPFCSATNSFI